MIAESLTVKREVVGDKLKTIKGYVDDDPEQPIFELKTLTEFEKYLIDRLDTIEALLSKS